MKRWVFTLTLFASALHAKPSAPNILFVDSSFPPIVNPLLNFRPPTCAWLREDDVPLDAEGPCYDVGEWSELSSEDVARLRGLIDSLSGTASTEAKAWQSIETSVPAEAQRVKGRYLLSVHGTRSIAVAALSSQGKLRPLALRNFTSKAGSDVIQSTPAASKNSATASDIKAPLRKPYANGCALTDWSEAELQAFAGGEMREAQKRIGAQLGLKPTMKVVNVSLGYKRSWIQQDQAKCSPEQVDKEYSVLKFAWRNLLRSFPDRIFVVAAGNESENFDRPDLRDNDLWPHLSEEPNLLLVGAMSAAGTRLDSSNYGLPVHVFALGEMIPALSPLPTQIGGHPSRLRGTSFSAPLVAGRAVALWEKHPKWTVAALKSKLIETFNAEQFRVAFAQFEKLCKGEKTLDPCLEVMSEFMARPLLWSNTHELYVKGRSDWGFKPFAVQFQKELPVLGETRLIEIGGELLPSLIFKPSDNPYELLITLHHEIYHLSTIRDSAKNFETEGRVKGCITPYQLALLRDEIPAYQQEMKFFESAPAWFRKKLSGKKYRSEIFAQNIDAPNFYKRLRAATSKDSKFLVKRFVDLGAYPPCVLDVF